MAATCCPCLSPPSEPFRQTKDRAGSAILLCGVWIYVVVPKPMQQVPSGEDDEIVTPTVENSSNPVFAHQSALYLASSHDWGRVCGYEAALVFRVWRRRRGNLWDSLASCTGSPAAVDDVTLGDRVKSAGAVATAEAAAGRALSREQRFGDELVGSAVVGLEVLHGCVTGRASHGLREIDGWYHVLDDLQRPQGQLKVRPYPGRGRVCPALESPDLLIS